MVAVSANPLIPVASSADRIIPPTAFLPFTQSDGRLSPSALQMLQQFYAAIAGDNGILDVLNILVTGGLYDYSQPLAGETITTLEGERRRLLDPAGILATLTLVLPPNPTDGNFYDLITSKEVTVMTITAPGGASISNGAPFLFAGDTSVELLYRAANTTWYWK